MEIKRIFDEDDGEGFEIKFTVTQNLMDAINMDKANKLGEMIVEDIKKEYMKILGVKK